MSIKNKTSSYLIKGQLVFLSLFLLVHCAHAENNALSKTKTSLKQLQTKMIQLQHALSQANDKRSVLNQALALAEKQMGESVRQLHQTQQAIHQTQLKIDGLQQQMTTLNTQLREQQALLAQHLRTRYRMGEHQPLKWFLNQEKPYAVHRVLTYYQYVIKANQQALDKVRMTQNKLAIDKAKLDQELNELQKLQQKQHLHQQQYDHNKRYHTALIKVLDQHIQNKQQTLATYRKNQLNLTRLLTTLSQQSVVQTRHSFTQMRKKLMMPVTSSRSNIHKLNQGVVFVAQEGSPVHAIFPGKIVFSDWLNGYGLLLIVDHGWGFMTLYANNQALFKQKGDMVNQGEQIATVGHSGGFKQNGLYFEIRQRGKVIPPLDWLS